MPIVNAKTGKVEETPFDPQVCPVESQDFSEMAEKVRQATQRSTPENTVFVENPSKEKQR